uniref:Galactokinase n=1 Tax=Dunaliella tertiolecta TaxID=3047 RepID=A0A7S3R3S0_DUNTE|mmetsp:Transcript_21337/g.59165  ORF Transcript_21337/g.59165 Transcript_21337/m.59165 type:complete len:498 (-) Transcript_21337:242-1735(-)
MSQGLEIQDLCNTAGDSRIQNVVQNFQKLFGQPCDVLARAPGRVNVIGEHVDYSGGSVLPIAVGQDCIVALRMDSSLYSMQLRSTRPQEFTPLECSIDPQQPINTSQHTWGNYVLAAYKGVHEHMASAGSGKPSVMGLQVLVDGNVPEGAGLSSSSALVVASMLSLLTAYGALASMTKSDVAKLASRSERHVGTEGGGMDQAVSLMAHPGCALHVRFDQPQMQVEPVQLPPNVCFAVCHSLVEAQKAQGAVTKFNMRVAECRLAAKVLQHLLQGQGVKVHASVSVLGHVVPMLGAAFGDSYAAMHEGVRGLLHAHAYSADEVAALCGGVPLEDLLLAAQSPNLVKAVQLTASAAKAGEWQSAPCLQLQQRALHFFSECQRVFDFKSACQQAGTKLEDLGALLTASHRSCADLYECSCPELEEVVEAAIAAGAKGARLTGAGWGGCIVCLVHAEEAAAFRDRLWHSHYASRIDRVELLDKCVFCVDPGGGASVFTSQA